MMKPNFSSGTAAAVWQTIALLLISVTLALAGYFGTNADRRIKTLEDRDMVVVERLGRMEEKLDTIIQQHRDDRMTRVEKKR